MVGTAGHGLNDGQRAIVPEKKKRKGAVLPNRAPLCWGLRELSNAKATAWRELGSPPLIGDSVLLLEYWSPEEFSYQGVILVRPITAGRGGRLFGTISK